MDYITLTYLKRRGLNEAASLLEHLARTNQIPVTRLANQPGRPRGFRREDIQTCAAPELQRWIPNLLEECSQAAIPKQTTSVSAPSALDPHQRLELARQLLTTALTLLAT